MPGPEPAISDLELLEVFVAAQDPAFVPSEIAEHFDVTEQTARNRLSQIHEKGYLASKKPGERTILYWITEEGHQHYWENQS